MTREKGNSSSLSDQPLIVLAGAAGFLGSHLAESLIAADCQVVGLDNLSTGSQDNLSSLKGNPSFDLLECDITKGLPKHLPRKKITHVVVSAGTSFYLGQEKKELEELLVACLGTKNLLDLAILKKATFLLLSSIDIYKGVAGSLSLEHYYDQLEMAQQLSFLEGRRFSEALTQQYSDLYNLDARIARLSWVYGPRLNLNTNHWLARLIRLWLDQKDLILDEDGSRQLPLLFVSDAVYGLARLLLSTRPTVKKSIFNFFNPEPVSLLSIAYTLKDFYEKEPRVEFLPKGHRVEFHPSANLNLSRTRRELLWEPKVDLTEGIRLTLNYFKKQRAQEKIEEFEKKEAQIQQRLERPELKAPKGEGLLEEPKGWLALKRKQKEKVPDFLKGLEGKKKKNWLQKLSFPQILLGLFISLGVTFLVLPFLVTVGLASWGIKNLQAKKFEGAQNKFLIAQSLWGSYLNGWIPVSALLGQKKIYDATKIALTAAFFAARSAQGFSLGLKDLSQVALKVIEHSPVLGGQNQKPIQEEELLEDLKMARLSLQKAESDFLLFSQNYQKTCEKFAVSFWSEILQCQKGLELSGQAKNLLKVSPSIFELSASILGLKEKSTFLVLLQNNTEVRATGGFIGSYLVVDFEQGRMIRFKVDDIYNPEGILKQRITAPEPVQKYMGVKELGIRDANWWPNFPESAEKIATLYEFATGEKIAQVIAVNLEVVKSLLEVSGEIYLADYNETVTTENLFERAEVHSEVGFEPGSTGKRDFLGTLANQLIEQLLKNKNMSQLKLLKSLLTNLSQKNILLYSRLPELQKSLEEVNWAGSLTQVLGDYLLVVDSNVGGNKANYWIKRSLNYELNADRNGNLTATLKVKWQHTGLSESWPGGTYKNFLRVYVPLRSNLLEQINFSDEVMVYEEYDKTVLGGLVEIPVNSQKEITLKYKLAEDKGFKNSNLYTLLLQKQSGVGPENFTFKLNLPVFLKLEEGRLDWNAQFLTDWQGSVTASRR